MARNRAINIPPAVLWPALALVAVHAARQALPPDIDDRVLLTLAFIPARYGPMAALLPGGVGARFWSPVTYALLHADWVHLGVNLIWMVSFGSPLARRFGGPRFLLLSLLAAVAGAAVHYATHAGGEGLVIGASGAISGMMAATARFAFAPGGPLTPRTGPVRYDHPAEPLRRVLTRSRALGFVLVWFGMNLATGLAGETLPGAAGPIAWEAHVGGFLAGLLAFPLLDPIPRRRSEAGEPHADDDLAS